jgi:hypothetical protein
MCSRFLHEIRKGDILPEILSIQLLELLKITLLSLHISVNGSFTNRFRHFENEFRRKYLELSAEQHEHEKLHNEALF